MTAEELYQPGTNTITGKARVLIVGSVLLALFLGALDALAVGSAMPTIIADLGGLELYSWVFSVYLLTRAVALPIFGKLCDLYSSRKLFLFAIGFFVITSGLAGLAQTMGQLILFRAMQGIGAGANFALTYFIVAEISEIHERGKMMGVVSFVWGISSLLGPPLGGFIVDYANWRWIFWLNIPLGLAAFLGILFYFQEISTKKRKPVIDVAGALTLSSCVILLLTAFLMAGNPGHSRPFFIPVLLTGALLFGIAFYFVERKALQPILPLGFFRVRGFRSGNTSAFCSSFAIFSMVAYFPLFIQGAMGRSPSELGLSMIPLSLGWSIGAWLYGQVSNRLAQKPASILGSVLLMAGSALSLTMGAETSILFCVQVLTIAGLGMGFVSLATLLVVQNSLDQADLGVATASHQFARTLGGTIGIGISGSLVTLCLQKALVAASVSTNSPQVTSDVLHNIGSNLQTLFQPEMQSVLSEATKKILQQAVVDGVSAVFWVALVASTISLVASQTLPRNKP